MKNILTALVTISLAFGACKSMQKNADVGHNSKNSLDWQGVYTGTLPCADCKGVQTVLHIDTNSNYELETIYLDKSGKTDSHKGTFSWDKYGNRISLSNLDKTAYPTYYLLGENQLIQLDLSGKPITGELADKYILKKEQNPIIEKYWKLVEINGKPVTPPAQGEREAHLILKTLNHKVTGNAGCNGFGGNYEILPGNRIHFSQIVHTMMACPNLATENEFLKVLEQADNYSYSNDTMTLNKAKMAPLAKFVAVYF